MTRNELIASCVQAINALPGWKKPVVVLVIKGKRKTLAGKGSPRGQVLEERKGEQVLAFDAIDLLAWLIAQKETKAC